MASTAPVIQTENLTKIYEARTEWDFAIGKPPKRRHIDATHALVDLDLSVQKGEIFGFLGPNGAGKTTTIRLLLDLIRPTRGGAAILGMDVRRDSVELHRRIGFMPGELNLWKNLTGLQVVNYVGNVRGTLDMAYVNELAERFLLDLSKKVRDYSSGNRRKLGLVISLMHKPELLILDEPTGGLDPLMQQIFYELAREARDEGRTVFMSSHILSEVQAICDRVGILREGYLKAVESVSDLTHTEFRYVTLQFRETVAASRLDDVPGVSQVESNGNSLKLRLAGDFDPVLRAVNDHYIVDGQTRDPSLEEIFLTFYGNDTAIKADGRKKERVS